LPFGIEWKKRKAPDTVEPELPKATRLREQQSEGRLFYEKAPELGKIPRLWLRFLSSQFSKPHSLRRKESKLRASKLGMGSRVMQENRDAMTSG